MEAFKQKLRSALTNHWSKAKNDFPDLYGYSIYTEDGLSSIAPVFNCESDITVPESDDMYFYYRYGAVEWANFDDFGMFDEVNAELLSIMDCDPPEWAERRGEILEICLNVLSALEHEGMFGSKDSNRFVVICLSDSDDPIMNKSAKELNGEKTYASYAKEFS